MSIINIKKRLSTKNYNIKFQLKNNVDNVISNEIFDDFIEKSIDKNINSIIDNDTKIYKLNNLIYKLIILQPNELYKNNVLGQLDISVFDKNMYMFIEFYSDIKGKTLLSRKVFNMNDSLYLRFHISDNGYYNVIFLPNDLKLGIIYAKIFFYNGKRNKLIQLSSVDDNISNNDDIIFKYYINHTNSTIVLNNSKISNNTFTLYEITNAKFNERLNKKADFSPIIKSEYKDGSKSVVDYDNNKIIIDD